MIKLYINGMGIISPQQTWDDEGLLTQAFDYRGNQLQCVEPDYELWIDAKQLRRMSRILKLGVTAARMALKDAGLEKADGIITGTAYGCLEDTGSFLIKLLENQEEALNPTPFIQSTHNTIGSQIALLQQCLGYNQTYAHGAFSFESALLDAGMQSIENPDQVYLVGGVDEITSLSHTILSRFRIFRKRLGTTFKLFKEKEHGTVNGEGAAYFVVSGEKSETAKVVIEGIQTVYKPEGNDLQKALDEFLDRIEVKKNQVDLILAGKSGNTFTDAVIDSFCKTNFPTGSIGLFKHLCGEYPTASAFALWLGTRIIMEHHIPEVVIYKEAIRPIKTILIYNNFFETHHTFILIKAC